ncbi:MAG: RNA 3'-terminal phosphate cyclase [Candidatus Omnitrophica bacterium]|nr:RNA 3'-terminal phosphate cyclase [Candidatus Omnitrophota bacterium]
MIEIPGDYLEGGGQIIRTAAALSCITDRPIRIFNIRDKRPNPGIKPQLFYTLRALSSLVHADTSGLELHSTEFSFCPRARAIGNGTYIIDLQTSGAIGLALQVLLPVAAFHGNGIIFEIKGGTCGLGAVPIDYYPLVVFPFLFRSGLRARLNIYKRGYYPKGGGLVRVEVEPLKNGTPLSFIDQGHVISLGIQSVASEQLRRHRVVFLQSRRAREILESRFHVPIDENAEYADTCSPGSEINLYARTDTGSILWSDARGEHGKSPEMVGTEASEQLIQEISAGAALTFDLQIILFPGLVYWEE